LAARPYETGDVFWAPDPYHNGDPHFQNDDARPWLVVSTPDYPAQGRDYVCCALTSYALDHPDLLRLDAGDWPVGGPRKPSQIDPGTVLTIKHGWTGRYLGRIADAKVDEARRRLRSFL
jgi:mRNA-degrading endonuclease toxin of MazEF toxin-antitoxin module